MIWRDNEDAFIMIRQHDHAKLSGEFARHWKPEYIEQDERWDEVLIGCEQHDRGWIPLDEIPLWDDAKQIPFSFMHFPEPAKLVFYRYGINELENMTPYGGMLASYHYAALVGHYGEEDPFGIAFVEEEKERQERIKAQLNPNEKALKFHRSILELCDDLSLYVCLNDPGTSKEHEQEWWKEGFEVGKKFAFTDDQAIMPRWVDEHTVSLSPFPFEAPFELELIYRKVSKQHIQQSGLAQAFADADKQTWTIEFVPAES